MGHWWVVPDSPYLLKTFDCHINDEYYHCIAGIKYLFMYHFKEEGLIKSEERDKYDEVKSSRLGKTLVHGTHVGEHLRRKW